MESYLEEVLRNIINSKDMPRVQVERQISPFLDVFIEEIVNSKFTNAHYKLIGAEYPIPAKDNLGKNQLSSSIDYLMYCREKNSLLFVELKTDSSSFSLKQYKLYRELISKLNTKSEEMSTLYNFLSDLKNDKYKDFKVKVDENCKRAKLKDWNLISSCELLYITPRKMPRRNWGKVKKEIMHNLQDEKLHENVKHNLLHFCDFPTELLSNNMYEKEWELLREQLLVLDNN